MFLVQTGKCSWIKLKQRDTSAGAFRRTRSWWQRCAVPLLLLIGLSGVSLQPVLGQTEVLAPIKFDWPMLSNPEVKIPPIEFNYSPRLVPLWVETLKGSEAAAQRQVAQAIYRASFFKVSDLDSTVPHLQAILANPQGNRSTRIAAAHALIQLDARQSAELFRQVAAAGDFELCILLEPALAAWKDKPIRKLWRQRLQEPLSGQGLTVLAIRQLAAAREDQIVPRLQEIAGQRDHHIAYRVEAAKALAAMQKTPFVESAASLASQDASRVDRLVAAWLLQVSGSDAEQPAEDQLIRLLKGLSQDPETVVARPALQALLKLRPQYLVDQSDRWEKSKDPQIRRVIALAWIRTAEPQEDHLRKIVDFLNDDKQDVRVEVAKEIKPLLKQDSLKPILVDLLSKELDRDSASWRSKEQAIQLLVGLNHQPAAKQLVRLLEAKEGEVFVTAAWGLRKLKAVDQFPALIRRASQLTDLLEEKYPEEVAVDDVNEQLAQIFQAFGQMKYADALPVLKRSVRKNGLSFPVRSAAIWAAGMINSGKADPELVQLCYARILDNDMFDPEAGIVKQACVIALGQMKSLESVDFLKEQHGPQEDFSRFKWACTWSLNQINGDPILEYDARVVAPGVWFLDVIQIDSGQVSPR